MGCNANFMGNNFKGVSYLVVIAKVCHSHSFHLVWWHFSLVEDGVCPVPHGATDLPKGVHQIAHSQRNFCLDLGECTHLGHLFAQPATISPTEPHFITFVA